MKPQLHHLFFILFCIFPENYTEKFSTLTREKRFLVWPEGASRLQIITGVGVPVDLKLETVIIAAIMKANYILPMNISDITPFGNVIYQRRRRALSRWNIYDLIAQLWQMKGLAGKACILRTICELTHEPLDKNYGLFNEFIQSVFRPSSTNEEVRHGGDSEYYAAEKFGRTNGKYCGVRFADCKQQLIDQFTM